MADELKPCPFCGGDPTEHAIEPHTHAMTLGDFKMPDHEGSHVIECACGAGFVDDTREAAATRWNTRALTAAQPAQTERVAEQFEAMHAKGHVWISTIAASKLCRASLPTQPAVQAEAHPLAYRCYTMSESHLSGYRLILGFETMGAAQAAHTWVANLGKPAAQATPEPVGEPFAWTSMGQIRFTPPTQDHDTYTPLYTRPAQGVPEDLADLLCSVADNLNDMPISDEYAAKTAKTAYDLLVKHKVIEALAAAQAKGGEHE